MRGSLRARFLRASVGPPRARRSPFHWAERVHGVRTFDDEFRWLRDPHSRLARRQLRLEHEYAERALGALQPLQMALYSEMAAALPRRFESEADAWGGYEYYTRTEVRRDLPIHARRRGGKEEVLLDLGALADAHGYAGLGSIAVSADHTLVAYTLDLRGDEAYELYVVEAATRKVLSRRPNAFGIAWAAGDALLYTSVDERGRPSAVHLHCAGSDGTDTELFEEADGGRLVDVASSKDGSWLTINSNARTDSEVPPPVSPP